MNLITLDPSNPSESFPPLDKALTEPDGLLAVGGCLSSERLISAYRKGIFPWFNSDDPILWWSPNPRLVLRPTEIKISRSLAKTLRKQRFRFSIDTAFEKVILACAAPREDEYGTWITEDMIQAYLELHKLGVTHSAEAWFDDELVGGIYGVAIGQVFFGESMFHTKTDASKVVFAQLLKQLDTWGYKLVDCQVHSSHLVSLGAYEIKREKFMELLKQYCNAKPTNEAWNRL